MWAAVSCVLERVLIREKATSDWEIERINIHFILLIHQFFFGGWAESIIPLDFTSGSS